MPGEAPSACPNCGAPATGRFCAACGQDNRHARLAVHAMVLDAVQNAIGWESALFLTLRGIVLDPGGLVRDYVDGKRRRYVPPARLCLFALASWLVVARLVGTDPLRMSGFQLTGAGDAGASADRIRAFLLRWLEVLLFLSLPLRAWLLQLFFRRSGRNLAESLVLVLYVAGFSYCLGVLAAPLHALGQNWVGPARMGFALVWTIRAAGSFYGRGWLDTSWRALLVGVLHTLLTALLFVVIALVWGLVTGQLSQRHG